MIKTCYLFIFYICIFFVIASNYVTSAQQLCHGLDVLYPKTDSIIVDKLVDQTTYLILGNTSSNSKNNVLKEVLLLHEKDGKEVSKNVWIGQDNILKVSAIQQDLNKLDDLPNTFWFRASIEQDGTQCQLESGKFKINNQ